MTAPSPPTLTSPRLWQRRRAHYLEVFKQALLLLRARATLPEDEPNLNRELRFAVVTARRQLDPRGRYSAPVFEAQNSPDPDASSVRPHEYKRPDIQWVHDDPTAPDDRHREKYFVIECKRLGNATAAKWNLNEQYVISGILRFCSLTHCYGMHMHEGAMIGYVQSMGLCAAHADVCRHAAAQNTPPPLLTTHGWQPAGVSELGHQFVRNFPVSPFHLTHLWLDIQDIPVRPPVARALKHSKRSKPRPRNS